ncbi:hypothetical protein C8Q77DRAFT_317190 [Trametes polyzona]|nr:hypothetical protein C8Q77DRAFT_317190 [Trametes polyzona]
MVPGTLATMTNGQVYIKGLNGHWRNVSQPAGELNDGSSVPLWPPNVSGSSNINEPAVPEPSEDQSRPENAAQVAPLAHSVGQVARLPLQILPQHDYRSDPHAHRYEFVVPFNGVKICEALDRRGVVLPDEAAFPHNLDIGDKLSICFMMWVSPSMPEWLNRKATELEQSESEKDTHQIRARRTKEGRPISRGDLAYLVAARLQILLVSLLIPACASTPSTSRSAGEWRPGCCLQ